MQLKSASIRSQKQMAFKGSRRLLKKRKGLDSTSESVGYNQKHNTNNNNNESKENNRGEGRGGGCSGSSRAHLVSDSELRSPVGRAVPVFQDVSPSPSPSSVKKEKRRRIDKNVSFSLSIYSNRSVMEEEVDEMPMPHLEPPKEDAGEGPSKSKLKLHSTDTPRITQQGRRCGFCGRGNDGRPPPKKLVQQDDDGESQNVAYGGSSSASEEEGEPTFYDICDGFGDEPGWLGHLLGPINDRYGIPTIWVHQQCAVWSPEVYFAGLGCLKNVRAELCRGRALKCSRCGRPGATIGCRIDRCPKTYHLPCARISGCIFDRQKFLIACTDHRHSFQPRGSRYSMQMKKFKAKKMELKLRKLSTDAWRKDVEAEEKWLENGGEDEEFLKRESKRLHRDLLRIEPVYIGGAGLENSKLFEGWESVAGLQDVIRCMKEVVILPLLYPEFFVNLGITPPRGVLLHGYPGTGKTLAVRALIGSCARGDRRIAYFARKGADCLGKYVGDAERQLRLLFQVAERCQPSIIFFDEIDGLAPCRSRQRDQTHSSIVSTLLVLMDGLNSRGSVIVIGATNRPQAVDPALRRPGRFDREVYFPLPSVEDRTAILSLHTQRWPKPITGPLLKLIARRTVGFAGADLQALCTQAAIIALKRNFPLQEILSAAGEGVSGTERVPLPPFAVEERDWLEALACAPPPCSRREAGLAAHDLVSSPLPTHLIPCFLRPLTTLLVSLYFKDGLWMPPPLLRAAEIVKTVIVSSLKKRNLPSDRWWSYADSFLEEDKVAKEIQTELSCAGILFGGTSCASTDAFGDGTNDDAIKSEPLVVQNVSSSSLPRSISFASRRKSELRVLIAGDPRSGQRHLASCILHCFVGNVEIQKVDIAAISEEGHGDMVQGITQILVKCANSQSCMIFMPRIDLWALETCDRVNGKGEACAADHQVSGRKDSCSILGQVIEGLKDAPLDQYNAAETAEPQGAAQSASHAWSSFVEQVESISVSTSFIILATSEHPFPDLPYRIRQFFESQTSKSACSTPLQHTIPRFHVHVDRNFNHDAVISLSAAKLSRDVIQLYVQLIYQRAHNHTNPSKRNKICNPVQGCVGSKCRDGNHGPVGELQRGAQIPCSSSLEISLPLTSRMSKGKSSMLLEISTFGYQMLCCPHFSELCLVTSKLKDGPCAGVGRPWKSWPFKSCIFRPGNSSDEVAVACSSNNKSKDRSGLVRGLIAVGLLAYRGVYKSLREVSFEVRKVLELLVARVNGKIQSGKDRYQYVRLLSQVAYLEDVVNSWVHALQSLELDAQPKIENPMFSGVEYPNNDACLDNSVQSEGCSQNMFNGNSQATERPQRITPGKLKGIELSGGDGAIFQGENLCDPDRERRAVPSEDGYVTKIFLRDHNKDEHLQSLMVDNQAAITVKNWQIGNTLWTRNAEPTIDPLVTDRHSRSLQNSSGCRVTEPVFHCESGLCSAGESAGSRFYGLGKFHCQINGLEGRTKPDGGASEHSDGMKDTNSSPGKTNYVSTESGITCFYRCCSRCLDALHAVVLKILTCEWQKNKSSWTAEHVHAVVSSLSVDLLSAVRKVDTATNISKLFDESMRNQTPEILSTYPELHECHCNSSDSVVVPMECSCHRMDGCLTGKANAFPDSQIELDPNFVLRNGISVPVDSNRDASFHCKYESLCLCPLILSIVMVKRPFD